jgi:hypothetical protein
MYRYVLLIFLLVAWFALRIEHLFELFLVCEMAMKRTKKASAKAWPVLARHEANRQRPKVKRRREFARYRCELLC